MKSQQLRESLQSYSKLTREKLGLEQAPVVSYLGLWLVLASFGDGLTDDAARHELTELLGLDLADAADLADELIREDLPGVSTALGAWSQGDVSHFFKSATKGMPSQAALDAWASDHTGGLIQRFPIEVTPDLILLLASALTAETAWQEKFQKQEDGTMISYHAARHGVHATEAAGEVAYFAPRSTNNITVLSLRADEAISAASLWEAADELIEHLCSTRENERPAEDGPFWKTGTSTFFNMGGVQELVSSRHRAWRAELTHDLTNAPGVSAFAEDGDSILECKQAVMADYSDTGFVAAAVTAMGVLRGAMGSQTTVPTVDYDFTGPHAVVAYISSGPWAGVPLFSAWVDSDR